MAKKEESNTEMSTQEQIGFHKGSISVLSKEREELLRIVSITEQLIQMHVKALGEMGVDMTAQMKNESSEKQPPKRVPIENLI